MLYSLWKVCGMLLHFWMGLSWCSHFGKLALTWRVELKLSKELIIRYIYKGNVLVLCAHLCVHVCKEEGDLMIEEVRWRGGRYCSDARWRWKQQWQAKEYIGSLEPGKRGKWILPSEPTVKRIPANTLTRALQKWCHTLTSRSLKELRRVILRY